MKIVVLLVALFHIIHLEYEDPKIQLIKLTCEYFENPNVVDVVQQRLSWMNIAKKGERGQF